MQIYEQYGALESGAMIFQEWPSRRLVVVQPDSPQGMMGRFRCIDGQYIVPLSTFLDTLTEQVDLYQITEKTVPFVLAPTDGYYRSQGEDTTFSDIVTHTRAGNATMRNSEGKLVWAPHNLLLYSEDFALGGWATGGNTTTTVESNFALAPDGTMTADKVVSGGPNNSRTVVDLAANGTTKAIWARTVSGVGTTSILSRYDVERSRVTLTEQWQRFEIPTDEAESFGSNFYAVDFRYGTLNEVLLWGAHLYRSDLNGMADNPDTGDSYVPTTNEARFLPRTEHHIWRDGAWVKGALFEGQSTNLFPYSDMTTGNWTPYRADMTNHVFTQAANTSSIYADVNLPSDQTYTATVEVSDCSLDWVVVRTYNYSVEAVAWFNVVTGAVGTTQNLDDVPFIEPLGPGRWRLSIPFSPGVDLMGRIFVYQTNTDASFVGEIGATITFDGPAQLEPGSVPTSPIPTAGAEATRFADVVEIAPEKILPLSGGSPVMPSTLFFAMKGAMTYADTGAGFEATYYNWEEDANTIVQCVLSTASTRTGQPTFWQEESGVIDTVAGATGAYSPGVMVPFNIAARHGTTFLQGAVDGVATSENTTPTALPDLTTASLDLNPGGGVLFLEEMCIGVEDYGSAGLVEVTT